MESAAGARRRKFERGEDARSHYEQVLPRVYRLAGVPVSWHQEVMAAVLWAGADSWASHLTALDLGGYERLPARRGVDVSVLSPRDPRHRLVTTHRVKELPDEHRSLVDGIPVVSPPRAVLQVSGIVSAARLESLVEQLFHRAECTAAELLALIEEHRQRLRRGPERMRRIVVAHLDGGDRAAESELEVRAWRVIVASGLPLPTRQLLVEVDGVPYRFDFGRPNERVLLEVDGWAAHRDRQAFQMDRAKRSAAAAIGWVTLVATWAGVTQRSDVLVDRLGRALRLQPPESAC